MDSLLGHSSSSLSAVRNKLKVQISSPSLLAFCTQNRELALVSTSTASSVALFWD